MIMACSLLFSFWIGNILLGSFWEWIWNKILYIQLLGEKINIYSIQLFSQKLLVVCLMFVKT